MKKEYCHEIWVSVKAWNRLNLRQLKKRMWKVQSFDNEEQALACYELWRKAGYSVMKCSVLK